MISTTKTRLSVYFLFICVALTTRLNAQNQAFIQQLRDVSRKIDFESVSIKINNKDASYADILKIPDSSLLKAEVYPKKEAIKFFGKEEGKNGLLLLTLRKGEMFQANDKKQSSHYIYNDKGDSMYCSHITVATLGGDTTHKNWNQFLVKNLMASVPVENGCPPGIYNVDFSFLINKAGTVTVVKVFEDPGYGCGAEVKRLMKQSPQWSVGMCEGEAINYLQKQRITFLASAY